MPRPSTPNRFDQRLPLPAEPLSPAPAPWQSAFDHWLAARQAEGALSQPSSVAVYRSMWDAFARWARSSGLQLEALTTPDIEAFLRDRQAQAGLSDRHAWRFLKLLDGVLSHGAAVARRQPNPAADDLLQRRPAWRHANASHRDPLPEFLDGRQASRLVAWLMDDDARHGGPGTATGSWQALRNRSAAALQLGAGLAPGDVRAALVNGVALEGGRRAGLPWRIRVPAHGAAPERDAPIAAWAGRLVQRWLLARAALHLPGDVLFPGTRAGKPWSKVAHYSAIGALLDAAGLPSRSGGSFVLRHTFALRQLARGRSPDEVARWLGVQDPAVMQRYQRVVFEPQDVA